jgi:beta-glucosidase
MRLGLSLLLLIGTGVALLCKGINASGAEPGSPEQRAADLVRKMTFPEKISQMQNAAPAIPRLNIPAYDWWNEALHGVARAGLATVFPQAIGLAATWDNDLEHRIADVISTEARAKYNDASKHGLRGRYRGLTFWSPNINIFRDPRWGRGQETYGEDPVLTAAMAVAFIKGLQGNDPKYFKTIATSKHFAVHSGPEKSRHGFNVDPSPQDLEDTYLYAFRRTVSEAHVDSFMCAYNSVNGAPACASKELLQTTLRGAWNFNGYVVSDCGAVTDIWNGHHFAPTMAQASAAAVHAGTDLTCGNEFPTLADAVKNGQIGETDIDRAVTRLFTARIRLGLFDGPERVPFSTIGLDQLASPIHQNVALEAARKSMVLLKNDGGRLPLAGFKGSIAVVGPAADDPDAMLGNYNGIPRHIVTPLAGIESQFGHQAKVSFALGSVYAAGSAALIPSSALRTADDPKQSGLQAEYFNNDSLEGRPALARVEPRLYFYRDMQDPAVMQAIPHETFSARWRGVLRVPQSGLYQLGITRQECDSCLGNNSIRLILGGNRVLVETSGKANNSNETRIAPVQLESGRDYPIQLEYRQQGGGSGVELVWTSPADESLAEAVGLVKRSDLAIAVVGLNSRLEGEESKLEIPGFDHGDRTSLNIPGPQERLLEAVLSSGKPTIVVLVNGSALAVAAAKERAQAILEAWYPGQEGGTAIAQTLAGINNPGGRLPVTFYKSVDDLPPFDDYSMKGRTYRYFKGEPLFPFGYGLSYSTFSYSELRFAAIPGGGLQVSTQVTNTSKVDGDEVAQLYTKTNDSNARLRSFRRLHLRAGQTASINFALPKEPVDEVSIGGGQPNPKWPGTQFKTAHIPSSGK